MHKLTVEDLITEVYLFSTMPKVELQRLLPLIYDDIPDFMRRVD